MLLLFLACRVFESGGGCERCPPTQAATPMQCSDNERTNNEREGWGGYTCDTNQQTNGWLNEGTVRHHHRRREWVISVWRYLQFISACGRSIRFASIQCGAITREDHEDLTRNVLISTYFYCFVSCDLVVFPSTPSRLLSPFPIPPPVACRPPPPFDTIRS